MIRSEPITEIPAEIMRVLTPYSQASFHAVDSKVLLTQTGMTMAIYDDDVPLMVVGLTRKSLFSTELWLLVCNGFSMRYAKETRRVVREMTEEFGNLQALVELGWKTGELFARLMGFTPTELTARMNGKDYRYYEALR